MVSWLLTPTTESGQTLKVGSCLFSGFRCTRASTLLANGQQFGVSMPHIFNNLPECLTELRKVLCSFLLNFSFITAKRIRIKTSLKQRHGGQDLGGAPMCCPCEARTYPPGYSEQQPPAEIGSREASLVMVSWFLVSIHGNNWLDHWPLSWTQPLAPCPIHPEADWHTWLKGQPSNHLLVFLF